MNLARDDVVYRCMLSDDDEDARACEATDGRHWQQVIFSDDVDSEASCPLTMTKQRPHNTNNNTRYHHHELRRQYCRGRIHGTP